jgi:hypothetical protein
LKNSPDKKTRVVTVASAGQCDPAQSAVMDQDQTRSSHAIDFLPGNGSPAIRKNRGSAEKQMVKCVQIFESIAFLLLNRSNPLIQNK